MRFWAGVAVGLSLAWAALAIWRRVPPIDPDGYEWSGRPPYRDGA